MPELPDVEAFRRRFDEAATGHRIDDVRFHDARRLLAASESTLRRHLEGHAFTETRRHGKWLLAHVDGQEDEWLAVHFGMTGDVISLEEGEETPTHARVVFHLDDGTRVAITNQRKLGKIALVASPEDLAEERGLGPDALTVDGETFLTRLARHEGSGVKRLLMDQGFVSGIGNVWADEILHQARIHPQTRVKHLDEKARERLHRSMRHVLEMGVDRHAEVEELPRSWLLPHRRKGKSCPCGGKVQKIQVGGRSTYYCPECQER